MNSFKGKSLHNPSKYDIKRRECLFGGSTVKIFRRIPWVLLLCLLLVGCTENVEPTPPVTTVETTTVPPTTEETVPETTAFIPLPLELDVAADEVLFFVSALSLRLHLISLLPSAKSSFSSRRSL